MRFFLKLLRSKKGISPVVVTLLLAVIVITLSAFVYVYVLSWTSEARYELESIISLHSEEIMIDDVYYKDNVLRVYVRNLSPFKVIVDSLYVEHDGSVVFSSLNLNTYIEPDDVVELTFSVSLEESKSYNVKIVTKRGTIAERRLIMWG